MTSVLLAFMFADVPGSAMVTFDGALEATIRKSHPCRPSFKQSLYFVALLFRHSFFNISIFLNSSPGSSTGVSKINAFPRSFG